MQMTEGKWLLPPCLACFALGDSEGGPPVLLAVEKTRSKGSSREAVIKSSKKKKLCHESVMHSTYFPVLVQQGGVADSLGELCDDSENKSYPV